MKLYCFLLETHCNITPLLGGHMFFTTVVDLHSSVFQGLNVSTSHCPHSVGHLETVIHPSTYLHLQPLCHTYRQTSPLSYRTHNMSTTTKSEQKLCWLYSWWINTLDFTLAVLRDHTCAVLLARWPFVDVQSCVWGSSIQHNPILQGQF